MPPDESRVVAGSRADRPFRRPDVRDRALGGRDIEDLANDRRQPSDGNGDERDLCSAKSALQRVSGLYRGAPSRDLERPRVLVPADDVPQTGPDGCEAERGADEPGPDDGDAHGG